MWFGRRKVRIGDGIDDTGGTLKLAVEPDIHLGGIERIETDLDALAGQMGRRFVEAFPQQECGIAPDQTSETVEEQAAQVSGGRQLTNLLDIPLPAQERRGLQSTVAGTVIGILQPSREARVQILDRYDVLQIQACQKLFPYGAEEAF